MNLTLFILLNSATDFSLQSDLINDRIGDRIWKREITVTEVKNANEFRSQGNGLKKG